MQSFRGDDWRDRIAAPSVSEEDALRALFGALDLAYADAESRAAVHAPPLDAIVDAALDLLRLADAAGRTYPHWLAYEADTTERLLALGRFDDARARLQALSEPPPLGDHRWRLARVRKRSGSVERLRAVFRLCADHDRLFDPRAAARGDARGQLVKLELEQGRPRRALDLIEEARQLLPDDSEGDYLRQLFLHEEAAAYLRLGMPDVAAPLIESEWKGVARLSGRDGPSDRVAFHAAAFDELSLHLERRNVAELTVRMEELRSDSRWSTLEPWRRSQLELRFAIGLALEGTRADVGEARRGDYSQKARDAFALVESVPAAAPVRLKCRVWSAWVEYADGDDGAAREALRRARAVLEDIGRPPGDPMTSDEMVVVALEAKLAERSGDDTEASELARGLWPELIARYRASPIRDGGIDLQATPHQQFVLTTALEFSASASGAAAALGQLEELRALGSLARLLAREGASGRRPHRPGELRVTFVPGPLSSLLFVSDEATVTWHELPAVGLIESLAGELLVRLGGGRRDDASIDDFRRVAGRLYEAVVPPDVDRRVAQATELTVIGSEALGWIPFDALVTPRGHLLGWELPICHLPSRAVGKLLAGRPRAPGRSSLRVVVGDDLDRELLETWGLQPIEWSARDTNELSSAWDPSAIDVRSGRRANVESLGSRDAFALHVFAHGVYHPSRERPVEILLGSHDSGTSSISASELERTPLARLVFLSVCGAQLGPLRRGDDGRGRVGASALIGGADAVVLSSLPVELGRSRALSREFYDELRREDVATPSRALHRARRALDPDGTGQESLEPYLSVVLGLGHAEVRLDSTLILPARETAQPRAPYTIGAAALVAAAALFAFVRRRRSTSDRAA